MDDQSQSDQPLFQNTDEQERAYAPQQVPGGPGTADAAADQSINPVLTTVPPAAPTSTTAPELTLTAPVDLAATRQAEGERERGLDEPELRSDERPA